MMIHAVTTQQIARLVDFLISNGPEIGQALLSILGGLKVLARYTSSEADDKVLKAIEAPFLWLLRLFKNPPKQGN